MSNCMECALSSQLANSTCTLEEVCPSSGTNLGFENYDAGRTFGVFLPWSGSELEAASMYDLRPDDEDIHEASPEFVHQAGADGLFFRNQGERDAEVEAWPQA